MEKLKAIIAQIKAEYNIVDVISSYGINLKRAGRDKYKGLCPFHNDTDPSLQVSEKYQNYTCFPCGITGDVIEFIKHQHNINLHEALVFLGEPKGIMVEELTDEQREKAVNIQKLYDVVKEAAIFYHNEFNQLKDDHPAKQIIIDRGLSTNNPLYGYAPEAPNKLYKYLKSKGFNDKLIAQSELVLIRENMQPWDFFRGRLLFTLTDFMGKPLSFSSRKLFKEDKMEGKYVNGKDSPIFHKKNNLYNVHNAKISARDENKIYLVEGQFDVEAMKSIGIENVVAASGTAFTNEHARLLRKIVEDGEIVFLFDGDKAGIKAAISAFKNNPIIHSQSTISILPNEKDPCDLIMENKGEFKEIISNTTNFIDFVLSKLKEKYEMTDLNQRYNFAKIAVEYSHYVQNSVLLDYMMRKISIMSALHINDIRNLYKEKTSKKTSIQKVLVDNEEKEKSPLEIPINGKSESDRNFVTAFAILSQYPEFIKITPNTVPKKFKPFLSEFFKNIKSYVERNKEFRFIPEEYTMTEFCKLIQEIKFLNDFENKDDAKNYYNLLINLGMSSVDIENEENKRAMAFSSMNESTDKDEIIALLEEMEK